MCRLEFPTDFKDILSKLIMVIVPGIAVFSLFSQSFLLTQNLNTTNLVLLNLRLNWSYYLETIPDYAKR